jgi:hypothetical protein
MSPEERGEIMYRIALVEGSLSQERRHDGDVVQMSLAKDAVTEAINGLKYAVMSTAPAADTADTVQLASEAKAMMNKHLDPGKAIRERMIATASGHHAVDPTPPKTLAERMIAAASE